MTGSTTNAVSPGRRHIIKRPRLTRLLDQTTARIILLVAPAGYGKTTLAREWLSARNLQSTWYEASTSSSDVAAFAIGVASAAARVVPKAGEAMRDHLRVTPTPDAEAHVLAELLALDLPAWPSDAWLVIDDYHEVVISEASDLFVDVLAAQAPVQLALLGRKPPTWATPRRSLYGEIFRVGADALTMTSDEATSVLAGRPKRDAIALAQGSKGWPAIIGLAALTDASNIASHASLPSTLYEYFAEELYRSSSATLRRGLSMLSLAPTLSHAVTRRLLGTERDAVIREAAEAGFLTSDEPTKVDMHPLLRRFLRQRLRVAGDFDLGAVRAVATALIELEHWDDAFALAREVQAADLLDHLVREALQRFLDERRFATLETWLAYARKRDYSSPVLHVAEAEIALRRGLHRKAQTLAQSSQRTLTQTDPFFARAYLVSGRARSLLSDDKKAFDDLTTAFYAASDVRVRADSAWNRFVTACELERDDVRALYSELEEVPQRSYDHSIRILTAQGLLAALEGDVGSHALPPREVCEMAARVRDPLIRSSFLTRQAWALFVCARYDDAACVLSEEIAFARRSRLGFVLPHALVVLACAQLGRGKFEAATAAFNDAGELAPADPYIQMSRLTVRLRLLSSQQAFAEAASLPIDVGPQPANPSLHGELLTARALALACMDETDEARRLADQSDDLTRGIEARSWAHVVRAVIGLRGGDDRAPARAFEFLAANSSFDALVGGYRAEPRLLGALISDPSTADRVIDIVRLARDDNALETSHPERENLHEQFRRLTRRETEVVMLLAQGYTNRRIAQELFVTEVTAKVHLRHIFDKLEVKSRTEAAVKAAIFFSRRRDSS
jgi:LuxR family maltose regulon positive regulatory protein